MMRKAFLAGVWFGLACGLGASQTPATVTQPAPTAASQQRAAAASQPAQPPATLAEQIAALVAEPTVSRDHWGVMVTTLDGTPIYSLNEAQLFQPASNAKLYTTAAAMALLGPTTTFETRVAARRRLLDTWNPWSASATKISPTLDGDIVLIGGGDPNLSARNLPYVSAAQRSAQPNSTTTPPPDPLRYLADLADQVAATGLMMVTGDVVGDDTLFSAEPYPSGWSVDDAVWGFGAPVSALTINDNQLRVTVTPAATQGRPATVDVFPPLPYYTLEKGVWTGAAKYGSHVSIDRAPGSKDLRIGGTIASDAEADVEEVAIQDPAEYAAIALKGMLESRGIKVKGVARVEHRAPWEGDFLSQSREPLDAGLINGTRSIGCSDMGRPDLEPSETVLATHRSAPLGQDVVVTNKVSQNLHAELLLRQLGKQTTCFGWTATGAQTIRSFLTIKAGLDPHDFVFYDGSGLSSHDLVTPRATAKLLQFATTQPWFAAWKASLPIGGEDGSLESRFAKPPLKDHVFAKTGTLGEARALSGYLDCASGRTVIFSIMDGNHLPGTSDDREVMDKIVAAIAAAE